jgi:hypothetical protein
MSSPTSGSDPNHPQGNAAQGQPGWSAPQGPPQGYGQAPQGYGEAPQAYGAAPQGYGGPAPAYSGAPDSGTGQRPGTVTAAAIIGIVIGALGLLSIFGIGLVFAFDAVLGILSLLSIVAAAVLVVGGIQTLQGKSPQLLILGSYASIGIQLLSLIWALVAGWGFLFVGLLGFVLPILIVALLRQPPAKQYYASRGINY